MTDRTCVLYVRVSSKAQAKRGLSIPAQFAELRAWSEAHGYRVVDEIADTGGKDSKRDVLDRPGINRMLDLCERQRGRGDRTEPRQIRRASRPGPTRLPACELRDAPHNARRRLQRRRGRRRRTCPSHHRLEFPSGEADHREAFALTKARARPARPRHGRSHGAVRLPLCRSQREARP